MCKFILLNVTFPEEKQVLQVTDERGMLQGYVELDGSPYIPPYPFESHVVHRGPDHTFEHPEWEDTFHKD